MSLSNDVSSRTHEATALTSILLHFTRDTSSRAKLQQPYALSVVVSSERFVSFFGRMLCVLVSSLCRCRDGVGA